MNCLDTNYIGLEIFGVNPVKIMFTQYLKENYSKYPSLFGGEVGKSLSRFTTDWVKAVLNPEIVRLIVTDRTLQHQSFLAGQALAWSDYVVFSSFQWARSVSPFPLLVADDPIFSWCEQMLDTFDGEARKVLGYESNGTKKR